MTDTEKSIKEVRHSPRSIPLKGVIVGPTTINLMRFSRRVHLITNKKHHQASTSPRQEKLKTVKMVDTPATNVTVVPRKKPIRKISNDDSTFRKPAPRKPVAIRVKKPAN